MTCPFRSRFPRYSSSKASFHEAIPLRLAHRARCKILLRHLHQSLPTHARTQRNVQLHHIFLRIRTFYAEPVDGKGIY
jgi:hypothetical protein